LEKKYQTSLNYDKRMLQAQAELTESDTLKKVGEWIKETLYFRGEIVRQPTMTDAKVMHPLDMKVLIESLLRGEMPEELC